MKTLIEYAKSFIGTSYRYGGTSPIMGWDCSEYVIELLRSVGIGPKGDANAKMLYTQFVMSGEVLPKGVLKPGALIFYGTNTDTIDHIDFGISAHQVIGMRGGRPDTTNTLRADVERAYCKIRPFGDRSDIYAVIMPKYPQWVILSE